MDPDPPRDDVGQSVRGARVHAFDVLETEELSREFTVFEWVYGYGGV